MPQTRFQDLDLTRPSRAGRPVQTASKAHCIGHLVSGPVHGRVFQLESRLEEICAKVGDA